MAASTRVRYYYTCAGKYHTAYAYNMKSHHHDAVIRDLNPIARNLNRSELLSFMGTAAVVALAGCEPGPVVPRWLRRLFSRKLSDRKSTRLNSSHLVISYAVFCLKKKKNNKYVCIFV